MKKVDYLSSLTSLRGIAALLVIIFHFDVIFSRLAPSNSHFFIRKGYLWVDFFFILSGFVMMHVYENYFLDGVKIHDFKRFLRARFARIYPLHLFSFLCLLALFFWYRATFELNHADASTFDMKAVPTNLLLLQAMDFHKYLTWNIPSWSISAEWWMYLVFPFLLIPFRKIVAWRKRVILLLIVAGYFFVIYYLYPLSNAASSPDSKIYALDLTYDYGFIRCFLGFLFGMLVYELYKIRWGYSYLKRDSSFISAFVAVIAILSFNLPDLLPVFIFAIIILISAYAEGTVKKFLNLKPLQFLGDISYSLYMMHIPLMFLLFFFSKKYPSIIISTGLTVSRLYCLAFVIVVIIVSTFTYNFVEMPMRKRLNPSLK